MVWPIFARVAAGVVRGGKAIGRGAKGIASKAGNLKNAVANSKIVQNYQRRRLLKKLSPQKKLGIGAAVGAGLAALFSKRPQTQGQSYQYNNNVVNSGERPHYTKGSLGINALIILSIIVHITDGLRYNYSIEPWAIGYRIFAYFVLAIFTVMVLHENKFYLMRETIILGLFLVFFPALIHYGVGLMPGAEFAASQIAMFIVLFPFWTIYIIYYKHIKEPYFARIFYWYVFWILIIFLFNGILLFSQAAEDLPTGNIQGIDYQETIKETRSFIVDTTNTFIETSKEYYNIMLTGGERLVNQTLGREYQSEIEYSRHRTGVFLSDFISTRGNEVRNFDSNQRIILPATLRASSFREEPINITFSCKATHIQTNEREYSREIAKVELATIDQRSVPILQRIINCEFDAGQLKPGRHRVELTAEFDFSTWAYTPHHFVNADSLVEFNRQGGNWNNRYRIPLDPQTVATNAPVSLGMATSSYMPIPVTSVEDIIFGLRYGAENIISPGRSTGEIKSVNKFSVMLPNTIDLLTDTCNQDNTLVRPSEEIVGFNVWEFGSISHSLPFELACNAIIYRPYITEYLNTNLDPVTVTIGAAIDYTYKMSIRGTININEAPIS